MTITKATRATKAYLKREKTRREQAPTLQPVTLHATQGANREARRHPFRGVKLHVLGPKRFYGRTLTGKNVPFTHAKA